MPQGSYGQTTGIISLHREFSTQPDGRSLSAQICRRGIRGSQRRPGVNTRMHWSFEDSAKFEGTEEQKLARFREVRDLMEKKIREWVPEQHVVIEP